MLYSLTRVHCPGEGEFLLILSADSWIMEEAAEPPEILMSSFSLHSKLQLACCCSTVASVRTRSLPAPPTYPLCATVAMATPMIAELANQLKYQ